MTEPPDSISAPFRLRVWGERACFTRPEMKVERVSYDAMTPSAARGVLEAILWKPGMRWRVERIDVLAPIRWDSVRRNEVSHKVPVASLRSAMTGGPVKLGIDVEEVRQQRAATILRDVDYLIHARIQLTPKAGPTDNLTKFVEMFRRRAAAGQCFQRPYLGTREFAADFELLERDDAGPPPLAEETRPLGWMLLDIDHSNGRPTPLFFDAKLERGSVAVPSPDSPEVRR
jgi:CRISPR-associated protein Cas5d